MARITIYVLYLPPEVEITGYQRNDRMAMAWRCGGPCPHHAVVKNVATTTSPTSSSKQSPRRSGTSTCGSSPVSGLHQAPFHRRARCNYRQHIIPPFKRKDVSYTYRFEQFALRSLIGSTAEEVAQTLGNLGRDGRPDRRESMTEESTDRSPACDHRHWAG